MVSNMIFSFRRICWKVSILGVFLSASVASKSLPAQPVQKSKEATAGQALSLLFDTHRTPPAKSMGLLQGNFLDAVDVSGSLQLAVVIDSSESMSDQLASIQKNLRYLIGDLDRILDGSIETAVVTYSDIGDKKVPVTVHTQGFADANSTEQVISQLSVGTGKPFFPEAIDLGVHRAIASLPWSDKSDVERWVLVVGDAPPYEPSFSDKKTGAKRWFETGLLVDLANQKDIKIHCLLCNSRDSEKESFEAMLDDTRNFMGRLSSDTGGLMLDMSYDQVRSALVKSARRIRTEYVRIGYITVEDIQNATGTTGQRDASDQSLRVVVLPFLPMDEMTFFHQRPEVQIATELRNILKQMPNTRVVQPRQIEKEISRLKREGVPVQDWPQALCYRLKAQLIVTGHLRTARDQFAATIEVLGQKPGKSLASTKLTSKPENLARRIIGQLAQTRNPGQEIAPLLVRLKNFASQQQLDVTEIGALSKLKPDQRSLLLSGLEALEQATGYELGDLNSVSLLKASEEILRGFLEGNPKHPYAAMLLASAQYNLAAAYEASGLVDEAKSKFAESKQAIQLAFQSKDQLVDELLKLELEGDFNLMVRKEFETSIQRYRTIVAQSEKSPLNSALHAHWMLAGIRSGDWGVEQADPNVVDPGAARGHLIQILAHWPDSSQSNLIRKNLMWDPRANQTRSAFFSRVAEMFVAK